MLRILNHKSLFFLHGLTAFAALLTLTNCEYTTPESFNPNPGLEQPVPGNSTGPMTVGQMSDGGCSEEKNEGIQSGYGVMQDGILSIRKEFFGYNIDLGQRVVTRERRKWLCAWAVDVQSGRWTNYGGLSHTPHASRHCNMEFLISPDGSNLEAREVNVDHLDDTDRWPLIFTIPINMHYFYEKVVDSRGRETNQWGKVTERENWQLSPFMDLDLGSIRFRDLTRRPGFNGSRFWGSSSITSTHNVTAQRSCGKSFFGFTGTMVSNLVGSRVQTEMRFNFLEFEGTPGFKKTPYHLNNAKHMNILHILGERPNGVDQVKYAAHWDFTNPVELCLNGFPDDYRNYGQIGVDVINEMNNAMEKIGAVPRGRKAFVVSSNPTQHYFDLRCPSITYIDDMELSMRAPLGIGIVNADVTTGEILYGTTVIWGGLVHYLINRDSPTVASTMLSHALAEIGSENMGTTSDPYFTDLNQQFQFNGDLDGIVNLQQFAREEFARYRSTLPADIAARENNRLNTQQRLNQLVRPRRNADGTIARDEAGEILYEPATQERSQEILSQLENGIDPSAYETWADYLAASLGLNLDPSILTDRDSTVRHDLGLVTDQDDLLSQLWDQTRMGSSASYTDEEQTYQREASRENMSDLALSRIQNYHSHNGIFDHEDTVENYYYEWSHMTSEANMGDFERRVAARSVIKNVMLHELGHVVGLGHQFEGNRLPERGTVPDHIYTDLRDDALDGNTNYSSIMDYQSGRLEVNLPYEKVAVKQQDELVLMYLYNQKYTAYKPGYVPSDSEESYEGFALANVPANGIIPVTVPGTDLKTTYMPQCSDIDAWLANSPYCRRWDLGHNAPNIVKESVDAYTDNFLSRINSFSNATGTNPFWASYRLWRSTYSLMNYNRTFYDSMRYQMLNNRIYKEAFDLVIDNESAMLEFSTSCVQPTSASPEWQNAFSKLALAPAAKAPYASSLEDRQDAANYGSLLSTYETVLGEQEQSNSLNMTDEQFLAFEDALYEQGVAFTEVQKLCRATNKSLDITRTLLSLKGPDHRMMEHDEAISPTGLRGGNASYDYSKLWGTYSQLGLLPMKLAVLDLFTRSSSTMRYWWWNIGKPKYNDSIKGKYGYFALYPREFTDIVSTSIKNNMGFGDTGEGALYNSATMSIANLYMPFFLRRTFRRSGDQQHRSFYMTFIDEIRDQTRFDVGFAAVVLEAEDKTGQPQNLRFGFKPSMFNFANRSFIDLTSAYVLPKRQVIVEGNENQIILPLTKLRFLSQRQSYVMALNITYQNPSYDDQLQAYSVKNAISELTNNEIDKCIYGTNGLQSFFSGNEEFTGFVIEENVATDRRSQERFEQSVDEAYRTYVNLDGVDYSSYQTVCEPSVNGIGLISSTALALRGFFIPQIFDYVRR